MSALGIASWAFVGFSASLVGSAFLLTQADSRNESERALAFEAHVHELLANEHVEVEAWCTRATRQLRAVAPNLHLNPSELSAELARVGDAEDWAFLETDAGPETLFVAGPAIESRLGSELLERALGAPIVVGEDAPRVMRACALRFGDARMWLVRARSLHAFEDQLGEDAHAMGLMMYAGASPRAAEAVVLTIAGEPSALTRVFQVDVAQTGLWPLLLRAVVASLFAAGLCAELARRAARNQRASEDAMLSAIEEAATRIGQGDLSTTVMRTAPGRAERTYRTLDRMTQGLRETRAQLREAERAEAFRELSRHLAHELKNPLFPIRTAIETLRKTRERRAEDFEEAFEETTRVVLEEVQRLERIVREFAEFARLPSPVLTRVDVHGVVDDVVALHGRERVLAVHDGEPRYLRADRELIMQLLTNLVLNALDASDGRVSLRCTEADGCIHVHVDDTGPGVAEHDRERIFEPYFTTKEAGTGLGLAIARRIAREHGGELAVSSGPGGGARFTLTLPTEGSEPGSRG